MANDNHPETKNPAQSSLEYIPNPLGTYTMARNQVYQRCQSESAKVSRLEDTTWPEILQSVPHQNHSFHGIDYSTSLIDDQIYSNAADSFPSPEESLLRLPHWASGISIMGGMGYPNFLEEVL